MARILAASGVLLFLLVGLGGCPQGSQPEENCTPRCDGVECGDDGCGGSCGECDAGVSCIPACGVKECGDDGCGGGCGECDVGAACVDGTCEACIPACGVKECGDDGCGGGCGECEAGAACVDGTCECVGSECGEPFNEPAGFTLITANEGSTKPSDWWLHDPSGNLSWVPVAGPGSDHSIRYRYPEGHPGGSGVGMMGHGSGNGGAATNMKVNGEPVREIYLRYHALHSVGWQNPEGTSKMAYTYQMEADGSSRNVLHFDVEGHGVQSRYTTKISSETRGQVQNLNPNETNVSIEPGVWNRYELYSRAASAEGVHDGIVRWWVNGTLVVNRENIRRAWGPFTELHWNAVWGGGSAIPVQQEQYIWFNGIYLSGHK
jgi:hypothetical protein